MDDKPRAVSPSPAPVHSIAGALETFVNEFQFEGSKNTRRAYLRAVALFEEYCATANIQDTLAIHAFMLPEFLSWLKQRELRAATVALYRTGARRLLRFWRAKGWLSFSAAEEDEVLSATRISARTGNDDDKPRSSRVPDDLGEALLMAAFEQDVPQGASAAARKRRLDILRDQAMIMLLMATGLRESDVAALTINNILNAQAQGGRMVIKTKKTASSAHCFLNEETLRALVSYIDARGDQSPWLFIQHGRAGRVREKSSTYFSKVAKRGYGARLSTLGVWRTVKRLAALAGIDKDDAFVSPHAMRHWFAQRLLDADVPLDQVQNALGHASPATTKTIYAPDPPVDSIAKAQDALQSRIQATLANKENRPGKNRAVKQKKDGRSPAG